MEDMLVARRNTNNKRSFVFMIVSGFVKVFYCTNLGEPYVANVSEK